MAPTGCTTPSKERLSSSSSRTTASTHGRSAASHLEENSPAVEHRHHTPPDRDEQQSPGERGDVVRQPGGEEVAVEPLLQGHEIAGGCLPADDPDHGLRH